MHKPNLPTLSNALIGYGEAQASAEKTLQYLHATINKAHETEKIIEELLETND
ncbi:hypothetical protein [Arcanobacterium buesumense]|uniref:Uncharacterized protein n=1 Tax=Arcanobacterium buesumense TaxID=2722751 RepID=A0A6H2ELT2_9ACTO|nr:hypothetical protein [Arcanobacterium buesumense]QJC22029.1 hypothetical protein HC352_05610 [Arcanobacterium buesumense]